VVWRLRWPRLCVRRGDDDGDDGPDVGELAPPLPVPAVAEATGVAAAMIGANG